MWGTEGETDNVIYFSCRSSVYPFCWSREESKSQVCDTPEQHIFSFIIYFLSNSIWCLKGLFVLFGTDIIVVLDVTPCSLVDSYQCSRDPVYQTTQCYTEDGGTCFSETSVNFQWTTWYFIPEDSTLHSPLSEPQIQ
jgi:hypothetical protein